MQRPALFLVLAILTAWANAQDRAPSEPGPTVPGEPEVVAPVFEDQGARIEELRVRGQTRRIVVQPKPGVVRAYEIVPAHAGQPERASAGQRVWSFVLF